MILIFTLILNTKTIALSFCKATSLGLFAYVKVYSDNPSNEFKLKLIHPDRKLRTYQGNIPCTVFDGGIRIINEIFLDDYIAGVTEAEAGSIFA